MRVVAHLPVLNVAPDNASFIDNAIVPCEHDLRPGMEEEEDDHFEEHFDEVALAPFAHQVGGHSPLFLMDQNTVCKPLIPRELRFYQDTPLELRPFLAGYKGQIQVNTESDPTGLCHFVVRNNAPLVPGVNNQASHFRAPGLDQKNLPRFRHGSGSSTGEDFITEDFVDEDDGESDENSTASEETAVAATSTSRKRHLPARRSPKRCVEQNMLYGLDSWSVKCQEKQLTKSKKDDPCLADFLLLENVCVKFKRPCILDLKMGTRQHGDDAPKEKMDRQMEKCASTTSKKIGVRACGMKVYHPDLERYTTWNKYFGRALSVEGFKTALHDFLYNGTRFLRELIPDILQQLRQLSEVIHRLDGFRFYSSSLLIMYEGLPVSETETVLPAEPVAAPSGKCLVDVKMIDFAHSSLPMVNGTARHGGPDKGYLFGLENLIHLLEELGST